MSLVSIIVPNFNHSKYLDQRLESILAQTFQDFEIILLDDQSTDGSREILKKYARHPKVTHAVFNENNTGSPFLQWEKGIALASGAYIWIAESDDWCEPSLLETLVEPLMKDKDCVISYCQSICVNDRNDVNFQSMHRQLSETVEGETFIKEYLSVPVRIFNASMVVWRKEKYQYIPNEFTSFKFTGDWFFWIYLAQQGNVHISGKVLNYFRKHDGDVSGKAYKSGLNFIEELRIINQIYIDGLISEKAYYKAYKKKYVEYWFVRNQIDPANKTKVEALFSNSLSTKTSLTRLIPVAIWKQLRRR
ncbi:glycosyltransferase family 2 protein [Arcticibacter sp.]|uniref:glycosyltransferase family 2 protein n=1 Tax=Arcticibacter sp. TaxID=1872630 RepID=UPI003890EAB2